MTTERFLNRITIEVAKLRLGDGDIAVLSTEATLSGDQSAALAERFRAVVPATNRVLVLSRGMKVSALTRADIEGMAQ